MTSADFREVIRLVDSTVVLCDRSRFRAASHAILRREIRMLTLKLDLLRIRLSQAPVVLARN